MLIRINKDDLTDPVYPLLPDDAKLRRAVLL